MGISSSDITGAIVAHRNDGMGGRLTAMLNALRVARDHDLPFYVGWTTHGLTRPELRNPDHIFDPDFLAAHFFDVDVLQQVYPRLIDLMILPPDLDRAGFQARIAAGDSFMSQTFMDPVVLPWEDADQIARAVPGHLRDIRFSQVVTDQMAHIDQALAGSDLAAYHIRRGDIIRDPIASNKLWPNKYIPREFYELHLERLLAAGGTRVLVFSDTPEEVARIKQMGGDAILTFDDLVGGVPLEQGQRDFLELYTMSRCPRTFGPPESAFSQTAARIGGGQVIAVEQALSEDDRITALDRMTERMESRSPLFLGHGDTGQNMPFMINHQLDQGRPDRARDILDAYLRDGFDRAYIYRLLSELAIYTGNIDACDTVHAAVYDNPVYLELSIAEANGFGAIASLAKGDHDTARRRAITAFWERPLEPTIVQTVMNMALTCGALDRGAIYPIDPALIRERGSLLPPRFTLLAPLNDLTLPGRPADGKWRIYPWDLAVRDWDRLCGKRRSRAYTNLSKIDRQTDQLAKSYSRITDSPAYLAARGVFLRAMGQHDDALKLHRQAVGAAPDNALYRKRLADTLFLTDMQTRALDRLSEAVDLSDNHPCYLADLAERLRDKGDKARATALWHQLADMDHDLIEIRLMTAEILRRSPDTRDRALALLEQASQQAHVTTRLQTMRARVLMDLGRVEEAQHLYQQLVDWGLSTPYLHADIHRRFGKLGREEFADAMTARSRFNPEEIEAVLNR